MIGKIRPKRIVMPSELTGAKRKRRSGPVITYKLEQSNRGFFSSVQEFLEGVNGEMVEPESFATMNTKEQQAVLLDLVREGKSDVEIGEMLEMSQWQVRNMRYKLGIKKDRGGNVQLEPLMQMRGDTSSSLVDFASASDQDVKDEEGLVLRVSGSYSASETAQRLQALASLVMVDADDMEYILSISLRETPRNQNMESVSCEPESVDDGSGEAKDQDEDPESSARVS